MDAPRCGDCARSAAAAPDAGRMQCPAPFAMHLLRDHRGKPSTTRVAALACALTACAAVLLLMFGHGQTPDLGCS